MGKCFAELVQSLSYQLIAIEIIEQCFLNQCFLNFLKAKGHTRCFQVVLHRNKNIFACNRET